MQVERCYLVSKSGAVSPLEPGPDGAATVVPTFTPAQFERTLNTRAATSSVERRQRTMNVRALQHPAVSSRTEPYHHIEGNLLERCMLGLTAFCV